MDPIAELFGMPEYYLDTVAHPAVPCPRGLRHRLAIYHTLDDMPEPLRTSLPDINEMVNLLWNLNK